MALDVTKTGVGTFPIPLTTGSPASPRPHILSSAFSTAANICNHYARSSEWANEQTLLRVISTATNILTSYVGFPEWTSIGLVAPWRITAVYCSLKKKNYSEAAFSIATLAVQFLPWGKVFAACIDVAVEYENRRSRPPSTFLSVSRLDPSIAKNACKILGLADEEALTKEIIDQKREHIVKELTDLMERATRYGNSPIQKHYSDSIEEVNRAWATLTRDCQLGFIFIVKPQPIRNGDKRDQEGC